MSIMDELKMGSSLSLRSVARMGSALALFNCARFGKSLSVLDFNHFGSSMSVRGIVRLGSGLSLYGAARMGAPGKQIQFHTATTYIRETGSGPLEVFIGGTKSATFESDGGILHGSWNVESSLVTSDRRLKTNIMPLQRTLRDVIAPRGEKKAPASSELKTSMGLQHSGQGTGSKGGAGDGALWLLRQLRPVSYSFRKGMDSKFMRFGFIADELESVVPEVVRRPGDREVTDQKAVVYQDLIALLAAATQSQQKLIEQQQDRVQKLEERLLKLEQAKEDKKTKKRKLRRRKAKAATNMTNVTNSTAVEI